MMRASLKLCGYCALFVLAEVLLYASYRHHDARFHWFLHFLVGASAALLLMALIAWRRRAAAPFPLLWILAGHLFAMTPDFLFLFFSIIHRVSMAYSSVHALVRYRLRAKPKSPRRSHPKKTLTRLVRSSQTSLPNWAPPQKQLIALKAFTSMGRLNPPQEKASFWSCPA
ncbi:MAG TPA: hypothetical protein VHK27_06350 [Gammaproteobacteria bacterium]|nr:hypothetical protein [Gammaproteobacteria bacterium]